MRMRTRATVSVSIAGLVLIAAVLLWPSHPEAGAEHLVWTWLYAHGVSVTEATRWSGLITDQLGNVALFLPMGGLLFLLTNRVPLSVLVSCTLSAVVEAVQISVPSRDPSLLDIILNTVGGLTGALIARAVIVKLQRRTARESTTEVLRPPA